MMRSTTPRPVSGSVQCGRIFRSMPPSFFLRDVLHQHDHALDAGHQVHRAAHALDHLAGDHPVGEVALLADLHGAEDREVDLAAADHREAVGGCREDARAGQRGDGLFAGVDEVGVDLGVVREGADAQHAVLALQPDGDLRVDEVGHQRGHADAEVHVEAVAQFLGARSISSWVQAMSDLRARCALDEG